MHGQLKENYVTNCELTYPLVIRLRELYGWGSERIQWFLHHFLKLEVDDRTIRHWIKGDKTPFGKINKMETSDPVNRAYVLGALCGDASLYPHGVEMGVNDKDFATMFFFKAVHAYGVMPHLGSYNNHGKQRHTVDVNSILVKTDIEQRGVFTTEGWYVPLEIWNALSMIKNFLKGWFDSEGTVGVTSVAGTSSNLDGLEGIQCLLGELGVDSTIRPTHYHQYGEEKRWCYDVEIHGEENIKQFAKHVSFSIQRKRERLAALLEGKHYTSYANMPDKPKEPKIRRSIVGEAVLRELNKRRAPMTVKELEENSEWKHSSIRYALISLMKKGKVRRIEKENPYGAKYEIITDEASLTETVKSPEPPIPA